VEIKACEKFCCGHRVDIPGIKLRLTQISPNLAIYKWARPNTLEPIAGNNASKGVIQLTYQGRLS
jgi:hypothetical protein